jgi:hypothetical protein
VVLPDRLSAQRSNHIDGADGRRVLENRPTEQKKRQQNPKWVRYSAAVLVQVLHEGRPEEPLAPNAMNDWTTHILEDAIEWLVTLGLCERITARTLYAWNREGRERSRARRKRRGDERLTVDERASPPPSRSERRGPSCLAA